MRLPALQHIKTWLQGINPKYIRMAKIAAAVLVVIVLIGGYILYSKRESILQHELAKITLKAKRDYNLDFKYASAKFTGLATVEFKDLTIVPEGKDTLLKIAKFDVGIKIIPLLFG